MNSLNNEGILGAIRLAFDLPQVHVSIVAFRGMLAWMVFRVDGSEAMPCQQSIPTPMLSMADEIRSHHYRVLNAFDRNWPPF